MSLPRKRCDSGCHNSSVSQTLSKFSGGCVGKCGNTIAERVRMHWFVLACSDHERGPKGFDPFVPLNTALLVLSATKKIPIMIDRSLAVFEGRDLIHMSCVLDMDVI